MTLVTQCNIASALWLCNYVVLLLCHHWSLLFHCIPHYLRGSHWNHICSLAINRVIWISAKLFGSDPNLCMRSIERLLGQRGCMEIWGSWVMGSQIPVNGFVLGLKTLSMSRSGCGTKCEIAVGAGYWRINVRRHWLRERELTQIDSWPTRLIDGFIDRFLPNQRGFECSEAMVRCCVNRKIDCPWFWSSHFL